MAGPGEMFGAPIGQHYAEQDMARMALLGPQVEHLQTQNALAPFRAAQMQAAARVGNARAGALEQSADTARKIAALAQNRGFTEEEKQNPGWTLANIALEVGDAEASMKYATKAATIDGKLASAATNAAREALIGVRTRVGQLDLLSRSARSIDGPEALQSVLQQHEQTTGERTGLLDPQGRLDPGAAADWESVRDRMQEMALSEKDMLTKKYREAALASAEAERKSRQKNRDFWQNTDNQEARAAAQTRGRGVKAGTDVFDKTAGEKMATDFITTELAGVGKDQARVYGREVAERAKQLRQNNPALTPREAIAEAFKKLDSSGKYEGINRRPKAASPSNPQALPADTKDPSKLQVGQFYKDGSGAVREWLGPTEGWGPVNRRQGRIGGTALGGSGSGGGTGAFTQDDDDELALATVNEDDDDDGAD